MDSTARSRSQQSVSLSAEAALAKLETNPLELLDAYCRRASGRTAKNV